MRACLLLVLFFAGWYHSFAQQNIPSDQLLLGYQEFPTIIAGHAADSSGNQYFTGTFKGELTINGKVLATGNGLEDMFWVKTDDNGAVLKYRIFGSAGSEQTFNDGLVMNGDRMLFGLQFMEPVTVGAFTLMPYTSSPASYVTSSLVCTDTSGAVQWVKRTNLQAFRIFYADSIFHVIGSLLSNAPAVKLDDTTVLDSTGLRSVIHLMFDKTGKLLNTKILSPRKKDQILNLSFLHGFSDKKLLLAMFCYGDSSFTINGKPVVIPNRFAGYTLLVNTDTSYSAVKTKILNPLGGSLYFNGASSMPLTASSDSVYAIISYETLSPFTSLDGFTQPPQRNMLYVFDSSLTARRQVLLSNTSAGYYPMAPQRRRLFFRDMVFKNGQLFFNGQFTGINESPMNLISVKDTAITILPGLKLTVDQNGPSRSFLARCDVSGSNATGKWYGDHHEYEFIFLPTTFFHDAGSNRLAFAHVLDNVWNPWLIDDSLNVISGAMRKNADMAEATSMVRYFEDGSRIVMGYARGETALDSSGDFLSNALRRDAFLVRLRANNQVAWYKRFHSTLTSADIRILEMRNGKAWFLINYVSPENDSNFIKVGTTVYDVKTSASLLANIDTAGNLVVLNLADPVSRYLSFTGFDFFSNGDIGAVGNTGPVPFPNFPAASGPTQFIFRINPNTGAVIDKRRVYGSSGVDNIKIDKKDQLYISGGVFNPAAYKLYLHDGTKYIDSLSLNAAPVAQLALLKMDWNHLKWQKRFSIAFLSRAELILNNDRPVLFSPSLPNQPLSWDGQPIHNGFSSMTLSMVMLDSAGSMIRNKILPGFYYNYGRTGDHNNLYLSGNINQAVKLDTIQINHAGNFDGLGLVLDSTLAVKKSFRIASPYFEGLLDMDIFRDSLVALAYVAQTSPQIYLNRMSVNTEDYDEDAYVGTIAIRTNVVTAVNNPMPVLEDLIVAPNPVRDLNLIFSANISQMLPSTCFIYKSNGQFITSRKIYLTPGSRSYSVSLPPFISKGVYYLVISNKKWTTERSFVVQ